MKRLQAALLWCAIVAGSNLPQSLSAQDLNHFIPLCRSDLTPGIALGDVNADGRLDIVFANGRHTPQPNLLYINGNRVGLFFPPRPLEINASYDVELADLDRDGDLDLVEGNDYGDTNLIWMNDGKGNFSFEFGFGAEDRTREVAVGDVTGDGVPDVVTANFVVAPGDASKVYVNDGRGRISEARALMDDGADAAAAGLGDFNGDGHLDIVLGTLAGHPNYLYLNDGKGFFPHRTSFGSPQDASETVAVDDLDRDGHLDVVIGNTGQQDRIFFGDGRGGFPRTGSFGPEAGPTRSVAIGDMDGDGTADVVAGYEAQDVTGVDTQGNPANAQTGGPVMFLYKIRGEVNQLFLNDGRGNLRPGPTFGAAGTPTRAIALGDVDGDRRLDIVVGNNCADNAIYLNRDLPLPRP